MINKGIKNELIYINYLNKKQVKQLNPLMQELIHVLYDNIDENDIVYATKNKEKDKTDIIIIINSIEKNLSLKVGDKNSFHLEPISEFIHFLIINNFKKDVIEKYLYFHYADKTKNGTGKTRISVKEYKESNQKDIDYLNQKFNNKEFIEKCIERFILQGRNKKSKRVDAIIIGKTNDFFYLTTKEIKEIIYEYINIETTGLHIGPLFIQPQTRNLNYNKKYEKCRYNVQIKWYNLTNQILWYRNDQIIKKVSAEKDD